MSAQRSSGSAEAHPRDIASLSFEEALTELEAIVRALEGGRATLAQAIADYERGTALRRHCEQKLSEAEAKVQAVVEGRAGLGLRELAQGELAQGELAQGELARRDLAQRDLAQRDLA